MRQLNAGETVIGSEDEVLRRQVHPAMCDSTGLMKGAFMDDEDWMSTLRGRVEAAEAHRRWTEDEGYESIGTYGVRVGDANAQGLPCIDDEEFLSKPDHASVVSEDIDSRKARARVARVLRDAAAERGALYSP